jgi:DNA-binding IclR family transcriptional regulator
MGKLLLAYLYQEARQDILDNLKLSKHGPNTICSKKALRSELEAICEVGLAVADEELAPNLISRAAPVRGESREVIAAINLAANKEIIDTEQLVGALAPHLISTADHISARMGYRREDDPHSGRNRAYQIHFER